MRDDLEHGRIDGPSFALRLRYIPHVELLGNGSPLLSGDGDNIISVDPADPDFYHSTGSMYY
jgi:hypothetical protein